MKQIYLKLLLVFNREIAIACSVIIVMAFSISISSCSEDVTVIGGAPDAPGDTTVVAPPISYKANVAPLLEANCTTATGCHTTGKRAPDLTAANSYISLQDYIKAGDPDNSVLMEYLTGSNGMRQMPTSGLNPWINSAVSAWISQGANNN